MGGGEITIQSYGGRVEGEDYCPNLTGCGGKKITVPI